MNRVGEYGIDWLGKIKNVLSIETLRDLQAFNPANVTRQLSTLTKSNQWVNVELLNNDMMRNENEVYGQLIGGILRTAIEDLQSKYMPEYIENLFQRQVSRSPQLTTDSKNSYYVSLG